MNLFLLKKAIRHNQNIYVFTFVNKSQDLFNLNLLIESLSPLPNNEEFEGEKFKTFFPIYTCHVYVEHDM